MGRGVIRLQTIRGSGVGRPRGGGGGLQYHKYEMPGCVSKNVPIVKDS